MDPNKYHIHSSDVLVMINERERSLLAQPEDQTKFRVARAPLKLPLLDDQLKTRRRHYFDARCRGYAAMRHQRTVTITAVYILRDAPNPPSPGLTQRQIRDQVAEEKRRAIEEEDKELDELYAASTEDANTADSGDELQDPLTDEETRSAARRASMRSAGEFVPYTARETRSS